MRRDVDEEGQASRVGAVAGGLVQLRLSGLAGHAVAGPGRTTDRGIELGTAVPARQDGLRTLQSSAAWSWIGSVRVRPGGGRGQCWYCWVARLNVPAW